MRYSCTPTTRSDHHPPLQAQGGRARRCHGLRRHFVPQFYLERFGNPLSIFDKSCTRTYKAAPSSIAVEKKFYSDPMEAKLGIIESGAAPAIHKILERKEYYNLNQEEQDCFVEFVAAQLLRTKGIREEISKIRNTVIEDIECMGRDTAKVTRGKVADLETHEKAISVTLDTIKSALTLMHVLISVNTTQADLWTSDSPVYVYNDLHPHEGTDRHIKVRGATVNVPLSPSLKVGFCDPYTYKYTRLSCMGDANVQRHNYLQALCSTRFVYSRGGFSGAERLLDMARWNSRRCGCKPPLGATDFQFRPDTDLGAPAGRFWMPISSLPTSNEGYDSAAPPPAS